MIIINQDKDMMYPNLSTKDIYYRPHFVFFKFMFHFYGWNLYARTINGKVLLGTFDSFKFCKTTIEEMKVAEKASTLKYTIPEESDEINDLDENLENSGGVVNV